MHTSPTASLGQNGNGGLNVYVREVASAFSDRGIATDIFTRRQSPDDPAIESLAALSRVIYLPAGRSLDKYSLYNEVPGFAAAIRAFAETEGISSTTCSISHYWLSGEVACLLRPRMPAAGRTSRTRSAWSRTERSPRRSARARAPDPRRG